MNILKWISKIGQVRRNRFLLRDLPDHMFRDIGLNEERARRETRRLPQDLCGR